MINYLQLGRNLRRFAPKVEPKSATYIFNPKGIYDFKQTSADIKEALDEAFNGFKYPVLELKVKNSGTTKGLITIKDGYNEISTDTFTLSRGANIEDYIPQTDGCLKKLTYQKDGIEKIGEQYDLLKRFLTELTSGLKNPVLELWFKDKSKYSIGNMVLKDGEKTVLKGYFSKTNSKTPIEKFHFMDDEKLISGYGVKKDIYSKQSLRLPQKLLNRLWMLDDRSKKLIKMRYGVEESPKSVRQIAKLEKLSGARIRGIINSCLEEMKMANTYNPWLGSDLDSLGHILSEKERYTIYHTGSSIDINKAETKIIKYEKGIRQTKK